jgi:hypothetical protein
MDQKLFNLLLLGFVIIMEKIDPTRPDLKCKCDPKKFLENADCPIHLKAKQS